MYGPVCTVVWEGEAVRPTPIPIGCNADSPSERLVYGSAATNSTPSLAELATIHSTVYSPRVPVGDGLRSIDIYRNAA